jgi:hypothetical protein
MSKNLLLLAAMVVLSGCNTIKNLSQISLAYDPKPQTFSGLANQAFSLDVKDVRQYVVSGGKAPTYLGVARNNFGIPHDVFNARKVSLETQLRSDLRKELVALGLVESPASGAKRVVVRVHDWNSDGYMNARFTYDIELTVVSAAGKQLAVNRVKDVKTFDAGVLDSGETLLQREIPIYYGQIIRELVRGDPLIILALGNDL